MIDYIKWRGDLSFDNDPLNEVDNIILSRVAYFPLSSYFKENKQITIEKLSLMVKDNKEFQPKDLDLLKTMTKSNRFSKLVLTNYISILNKKINEQFAAVTIIINNKILFVSFCGTIDSITGWHENFDMFYKKEISGQIASIKYLQKIINHYKQNIYVGGHSKGGNQAVFAASFIPFDLQKRIITIFNNDGPGFNEDILKEKGYLNIVPKIKTIVPETTIISTFFNRKEPITVIKSSNKGINQHHMNSWVVEGNHFISSTRNKNSYTIEKIIKTWTIETTPEQRKEFTDILFKLMDATNADAFKEIGINTIKHVDDISKVYKEVDNDKRKEMFNILKLIFSISTSSIINELKTNLNKNAKIKY
jgi:hypothetical protein